jgi:hypothetical protein
VNRRRCEATNAQGLPCRSAPLSDAAFCRMHDPAHAEAVAEGRQLGGRRRRREATLIAAYELGDISEVSGIQRILEIALHDALALDHGVARLRVIIHGVRAATDLLRVGDLEARLSALERDRVEQEASRLPLAGMLADAGNTLAQAAEVTAPAAEG